MCKASPKFGLIILHLLSVWSLESNVPKNPLTYNIHLLLIHNLPFMFSEQPVSLLPLLVLSITDTLKTSLIFLVAFSFLYLQFNSAPNAFGVPCCTELATHPITYIYVFWTNHCLISNLYHLLLTGDIKQLSISLVWQNPLCTSNINYLSLVDQLLHHQMIEVTPSYTSEVASFGKQNQENIGTLIEAPAPFFYQSLVSTFLGLKVSDFTCMAQLKL